MALDGRLGGRPWSGIDVDLRCLELELSVGTRRKHRPLTFRHPGEGRDPSKPIIWAHTPSIGMSSQCRNCRKYDQLLRWDIRSQGYKLLADFHPCHLDRFGSNVVGSLQQLLSNHLAALQETGSIRRFQLTTPFNKVLIVSPWVPCPQCGAPNDTVHSEPFKKYRERLRPSL